MTGQAPRNGRGRLAIHADGVELGPVDPYEWLCGFVYDDPTPTQRRRLKPLAKRIEELEQAAVDLLQPRDAAQDPPFREQGDGIGLEDLGRHAGAARWAIRAAVVRGWQAQRENVPTRKERRERLKATHAATQALLAALDRLRARDRMALQAAGLKGGSPMLPALPESDGQGWLVAALQSLNDCVAGDLARLGPAGGGDRVEDWSAGDRFGRNVMSVIAVEALVIWMHFQSGRLPSGQLQSGRRPSSKEDGPFYEFVGMLTNMVTGKPRYVRKWVRIALSEYARPIAARYGESVRGRRSPVG
jgi:hypothetical protein